MEAGDFSFHQRPSGEATMYDSKDGEVLDCFKHSAEQLQF